jgi:hypothetical protein
VEYCPEIKEQRTRGPENRKKQRMDIVMDVAAMIRQGRMDRSLYAQLRARPA